MGGKSELSVSTGRKPESRKQNHGVLTWCPASPLSDMFERACLRSSCSLRTWYHKTGGAGQGTGDGPEQHHVGNAWMEWSRTRQGRIVKMVWPYD